MGEIWKENLDELCKWAIKVINTYPEMEPKDKDIPALFLEAEQNIDEMLRRFNNPMICALCKYFSTDKSNFNWNRGECDRLNYITIHLEDGCSKFEKRVV